MHDVGVQTADHSPDFISQEFITATIAMIFSTIHSPALFILNNNALRTTTRVGGTLA